MRLKGQAGWKAALAAEFPLTLLQKYQSMLAKPLIPWILPIGFMGLSSGIVSAQDYPSKAVRIVTSYPGGATDFSARILAAGLRAPLSQPIIVENRGTVIAGEVVSKSQPDGYTLLVAAGSLWIAPLLQKMPFDPIRDFAPITMLNVQPNILVVHPSVPVKSVKELIALAKARPGQLNYASASVGSAPHLAAELFKDMAGVNIVHIPHKGGGPALVNLLGGEVQLMFGTSSTVEPHLKSRRLRALAITNAEPSALVPDLPTVAASGLPGYQAPQWTALLAPAKMSTQLISRINKEVVMLINKPDEKEKYFNGGVEIIGNSPDQLSATIKSEMSSWGKLLKKIGLYAE